MFGGFTARPNFGNQLFPSRTLGQFGNISNAIAANFLAATGITDATTINAINQLVADLTFYGLIAKLRAVYPFVGSTATTQKYNLLDPRDLDAAYRLFFSGGWTHSATGALPNGLNAYADTFFNLNSMNSINDISYGYYARNNSISLGSFGWGVPIALIPANEFYIRYTGSQKYGYLFDTGNDGGSALDCRGFNAMSRIASNLKYIQLNATISTFTSASSGSLSSRTFVFSRGSQGYEDRENAFGFIGNGLTSTDLTNLRNSVQTFQTTLSRNV